MNQVTNFDDFIENASTSHKRKVEKSSFNRFRILSDITNCNFEQLPSQTQIDTKYEIHFIDIYVISMYVCMYVLETMLHYPTSFLQLLNNRN